MSQLGLEDMAAGAKAFARETYNSEHGLDGLCMLVEELVEHALLESPNSLAERRLLVEDLRHRWQA